MDEKDFVRKLRFERDIRGMSALNAPDLSRGAEFAFGLAVGVNQGLRVAEEVLMKMIEDEKEKDV